MRRRRRSSTGKFPGLRDGFLFYVAGGDWRKNVTGLIEAYARLPEQFRERHQLVITYKLDPERRQNLEGFARELGIHGDQLLLTGFVPDRELSALYRRCGLFVFPSLYEGAGLPILEAMACGAPVIGSNISSVPEILGDLRATFDPSDPDDIARCIARTLDDEPELERLRRASAERTAHFTWDRVARRAIEGYERALADPQPPGHLTPAAKPPGGVHRLAAGGVGCRDLQPAAGRAACGPCRRGRDRGG